MSKHILMLDTSKSRQKLNQLICNKENNILSPTHITYFYGCIDTPILAIK
jgi:hypothetical protein